MSPTQPSAFAYQFILLLNRVALGGYVALAGYAKVFQQGIGTFYKENFLAMKPDWLPELLAWPYGMAIPVLELVVGLALIIGIVTRAAAAMIVFMLVTFTVALMISFGPSGGGPVMVHHNVILITLALWLTLTGGGRFALDRVVLKN